jgi:hypothetical protein
MFQDEPIKVAPYHIYIYTLGAPINYFIKNIYIYTHIHNKNMHHNSIPLEAWGGRKIKIGKILLNL